MRIVTVRDDAVGLKIWEHENMKSAARRKRSPCENGGCLSAGHLSKNRRTLQHLYTTNYVIKCVSKSLQLHTSYSQLLQACHAVSHRAHESRHRDSLEAYTPSCLSAAKGGWWKGPNPSSGLKRAQYSMLNICFQTKLCKAFFLAPVKHKENCEYSKLWNWAS